VHDPADFVSALFAGLESMMADKSQKLIPRWLYDSPHSPRLPRAVGDGAVLPTPIRTTNEIEPTA